MPDIFCSLQDVRNNLVMNSSFSGNDTIIRARLAPTASLIKTYCRREFTYGEYVQDSNASGDAVYLRETPVDMSVPFRVYGSVWPHGFSEEPLDADSYKFDAVTGKIYLTYANGAPFRVKYNGGYAVSEDDTSGDEYQLIEVPSAVREAAILNCAYMAQRIMENETGQDSENSKSGGSGVNPVSQSGLLLEAVNLLTPFRRSLIGRL